MMAALGVAFSGVKNFLGNIGMQTWLIVLATLGVAAVHRDGRKDQRRENDIRAMEKDQEIRNHSDEYEDRSRRVRQRSIDSVRNTGTAPDYHFED